jgi:hypothetical protein
MKKYLTVKCDQCEALVINGVACHEAGCPNHRKPWTRDGDLLIPGENEEEENFDN